MFSAAVKRAVLRWCAGGVAVLYGNFFDVPEVWRCSVAFSLMCWGRAPLINEISFLGCLVFFVFTPYIEGFLILRSSGSFLISEINNLRV